MLYDQVTGSFYNIVDARVMDNVLLISYDVVTFPQSKEHFLAYHCFRVGWIAVARCIAM
jgi:hypothetical protein